MRTEQLIRRERFETDTFPHIDALWKTALWLTMRGSAADDLVLETMKNAYREWRDSGEAAVSKVRLFGILTREFFGFGGRKRKWPTSPKFCSENMRISAVTEERDRPDAAIAAGQSELSLLTGVSDVAVKGAIARLRPRSRLILLLLYRERFSYAHIAVITDLSENTIRVMLTRLRRLIPRYMIETAACLKETPDNQPTVGMTDGAFDRSSRIASLENPFTRLRPRYPNASTERWENEGGAVHTGSKG